MLKKKMKKAIRKRTLAVAKRASPRRKPRKGFEAVIHQNILTDEQFATF